MERTYRLLVSNLLDEVGDLGPTEIAKRLGISANTASSAKSYWKRKRGYIVGTCAEPYSHLIPVEKTSPTEGVMPIKKQIVPFIAEVEKRRTTKMAKTIYPKALHEEVNRLLASGELGANIDSVVDFLGKNYPELPISRNLAHLWLYAFKNYGDIRTRDGSKPAPKAEDTLGKAPRPGKKETPTPTASDIADALLIQASNAIDSGAFKDEQLRVAKRRIVSLEQDNKKLAEEVTRTIRLHNEQVKSRDTKLMESVGEVSAIMTRAKMRD